MSASTQRLSRRHSLTKHFSSAYLSETATIKVGVRPNRKTFHVHRDILSFYSGYCKAALCGGFAETYTGVIKFETEEPTVFEGFIKWLYTNKHRANKITKANAVEYYMSIVKLWSFADRKDVPLLMNEMVDLLHQSMIEVWELPNSTILQEVYKNTAEESCLRRMLVDMHASLAGNKAIANKRLDSNRYIQNFLVDWIKCLTATNSRKPFLTKEQYKKVEMCPSFHFHEKGVKCTKKGTKRSSDETDD